MRARAVLTTAAAALLLGAAPAAAVERPIVYTIVVDGLNPEAVNRSLMPRTSALLDGDGGTGTRYGRSRSVMLAETNPNHVAMMTGASAGRSGIPANFFAIYAPLPNDETCAATGPADRSKLPSPASGENSNCLEVPTLFEAVKRQGNPDGLLTAAVFGKPKLGRIFAGRQAPDQPRWTDHIWAPCASGADDDDYCGSVPTNPLSGYAVDDSVVMNEVLRTVREGVGPQRRRPDFTFVNLHQVDSAGHFFGLGREYDTAVRLADREIGRLVDLLRERDEWRRTVLIVLSDHGMRTSPTKVYVRDVLKDAGIPEDQFLAVGSDTYAQVYVADRTSPSRFALLKRMRAAIKGIPGVFEALYREDNPEDGGAEHTLQGRTPGYRLAGERTGDIVVLGDGSVFFPDGDDRTRFLQGGHGAPVTRQNTFVVLGGGPQVRRQEIAGTASAPFFDDVLEQGAQAENLDVAATVMGAFGLAAPRESEGRFLHESLDLGALPGGGRPSAAPASELRLVRRTARSRVARLTLTGESGPVDVQRRVRRRWVRVVRASRARTVRVVVPRRGRATIRVRQKAASGAHGPWRAMSVPR